jgi:miniconductance mechanosensitive channel
MEDMLDMKMTLTEWVVNVGIPGHMAAYATFAIVAAAVLVLGWLADVLTKRILLAGVRAFIERSRFSWDNVLLEKRVFNRLSHIAPALVVYLLAPLAFSGTPVFAAFCRNASVIYMIVITLLVADSFLDALHDIYRTTGAAKRFPIKGFIQASKIIIFISGAILVLSAVTSRTPIFFLSGLGALTAVLMLIFKDAILGFVAGIQITTNDMVREDDWIEMPQYGADGDVIDISLTTVKVQNWDKTITTIPTYAFISQSFKNWRGMQESGGRRIKRALNIDIGSIRFCDEEMLGRFSEIRLIKDYLKRKKEDIAEHNRNLGIDGSSLVDGRHLTNIGTFRAYVESFLRNHPNIHQEMTFLVRQLSPTENGLPLEIYVFCNDQDWARYESIQGDIFDHLLAAAPVFDLRIFQQPTGSDFRKLLP